jgi:hypothetical protein
MILDLLEMSFFRGFRQELVRDTIHGDLNGSKLAVLFSVIHSFIGEANSHEDLIRLEAVMLYVEGKAS